jgi:hypothetical protein
MTSCAAIVDDVARHKCSDEVMRRAGLLDSRKSFGLRSSPAHPWAAAASAPVSTSAPAATSAPEAARGAGADPRFANEDQLRVTLATVTQGGDGKLILTTTEGAVWRQVESTAVRPTPTQGQGMTIEQTSFGGFMCKPGRWVAFRCYRVR